MATDSAVGVQEGKPNQSDLQALVSAGPCADWISALLNHSLAQSQLELSVSSDCSSSGHIRMDLHWFYI